ncbi:MAG: hypothetical protein II644_04405 [Paludibacteraceae bacterium]|nr:hypothetical protein [Paludibacteraceae bacterium]
MLRRFQLVANNVSINAFYVTAFFTLSVPAVWFRKPLRVQRYNNFLKYANKYAKISQLTLRARDKERISPALSLFRAGRTFLIRQSWRIKKESDGRKRRRTGTAEDLAMECQRSGKPPIREPTKETLTGNGWRKAE